MVLKKWGLRMVVIVLASTFTGCAGKGEKLSNYNKQMLADNVSGQELKKLFNHFIEDNNISDSCITEFYKNQGLVDYVESVNKVCYVLSGSTIKLNNYSKATAKWKTVDQKWHVGKTRAEYSETFKKKVKDREVVLNQFQGEVESFSKFKNEILPSIKKKEALVSSINEKEEKKLDGFLKSLKVSIQDKNNILPSAIKQEYIEKVWIRKAINHADSVDAVDYYLDRKKQAYLDEVIKTPSLVARNYKFYASVPSGIVGRFLTTFVKSNYESSYGESSNPIVFEVKRVEHNYIPSPYKASDKSLETKLVGKDIELVNKTKSFLDVSKISIYYDGKIFTKEINLELPPESKLSYSVSSFLPFRNPMLVVSQRNRLVKFGYAINYINKNLSKRKTLYKTDDQSIDRLLK